MRSSFNCSLHASLTTFEGECKICVGRKGKNVISSLHILGYLYKLLLKKANESGALAKQKQPQPIRSSRRYSVIGHKIKLYNQHYS